MGAVSGERVKILVPSWCRGHAELLAEEPRQEHSAHTPYSWPILLSVSGALNHVDSRICHCIFAKALASQENLWPICHGVDIVPQMPQWQGPCSQGGTVGSCW